MFPCIFIMNSRAFLAKMKIYKKTCCFRIFAWYVVRNRAFFSWKWCFFVKNINIFRIYIVMKIQNETYFPDKICKINDEFSLKKTINFRTLFWTIHRRGPCWNSKANCRSVMKNIWFFFVFCMLFACSFDTIAIRKSFFLFYFLYIFFHEKSKHEKSRFLNTDEGFTPEVLGDKKMYFFRSCWSMKSQRYGSIASFLVQKRSCNAFFPKE